MTKLRWMLSIYNGNGCVSSKRHKYYIDEKYKRIDKVSRYIGIAFLVIAIFVPDFFNNLWIDVVLKISIFVLGQIIRYFILPKDFAKYITIEKEEI